MINEKLGIPDNIFETTKIVYDSIVQELKDNKEWLDNAIKELPTSKKGECITYEIDIDEELKISDSVFDQNLIEVKIYKINTDGINLASAAHNYEPNIDETNFKITCKKDGKLYITFNVVIPTETKNSKSLIKWFMDDRINIKSVLSHELKHAYDHSLGLSKKSEDYANYRAFQNINTPFKEINNFCHNLYFMHAIENSVRLSEVGSKIHFGRVTKEKFLEFLESDEVYKRLTELEKFKLSDMIKSLNGKSDEIIEFFDEIEYKDYDVDNLVYELLNIIYINIVNKSVDEFANNVIRSNKNPIGRLFGEISEHGNKSIIKFQEEMAKYVNNPIKFFENCEKMFNFVSKKLKRKISKLYDMASDNKSIYNWELHNKISGKKNESLSTKIKDFKSFKK